MLQDWKPDDAMLSAIGATEWAPGRGAGVPESEAVVRIPARMIPILRKACDEAERAELR